MKEWGGESSVLCGSHCGRDEEVIEVFVSGVQVGFINEGNGGRQLLSQVGFDLVSCVISVKIEVDLLKVVRSNLLDGSLF